MTVPRRWAAGGAPALAQPGRDAGFGCRSDGVEVPKRVGRMKALPRDLVPLPGCLRPGPGCLRPGN